MENTYRFTDPFKDAKNSLKRQLARRVIVRDPITGLQLPVSVIESISIAISDQARKGCRKSQEIVMKIATGDDLNESDIALVNSPKINMMTVNILQQAGIQLPQDISDSLLARNKPNGRAAIENGRDSVEILQSVVPSPEAHNGRATIAAMPQENEPLAYTADKNWLDGLI